MLEIARERFSRDAMRAGVEQLLDALGVLRD